MKLFTQDPRNHTSFHSGYKKTLGFFTQWDLLSLSPYANFICYFSYLWNASQKQPKERMDSLFSFITSEVPLCSSCLQCSWLHYETMAVRFEVKETETKQVWGLGATSNECL